MEGPISPLTSATRLQRAETTSQQTYVGGGDNIGNTQAGDNSKKRASTRLERRERDR